MTNRITTPPKARTVIVGVDTHKHVHVAVAIDSWGIRLGDHAFVADSGGYEALVTWADQTRHHPLPETLPRARDLPGVMTDFRARQEIIQAA